MSFRRSVVSILAVVAVFVPALVIAAPVQADLPSGWEPRGEDYSEVVTIDDIEIEMSDGNILLANLTLPADANGEAISSPIPVLVTITAYNKSILGSGVGATLSGTDANYLVKRGYAYLTVDARGTGTSPGQWQIFGEREQLDAKEVVEWAAAQDWSDGSVGMVGASYMGITQLFAAGQHPEGLKAIFPQVPAADVYRDVAVTGGQLDVGFMPLWLGLVTLLSLPPAGPSVPPEQLLATFLEHLLSTGGTSLEVMLEALAGGDRAYDGDWYRERSPIHEAVSNIEVPTFLIGGHYDLFQRGTPMVFEDLHQRGIDVKMILGPWNHLDGSSGAAIAEAGYGTLSELQLRWFDRHLRGLEDPAFDSDIPDFTYYELGSGEWIGRDAYVDGQEAAVYYLSGTAVTGGQSAALTPSPAVEDGSSAILPLALAGVCSRSATQWTAGIVDMVFAGLGIQNPCNEDNTLNDLLGVTFETESFTDDLQFLGPLATRLYASSTTGDGLLSVHVSRVTPDGQVDRLTGGWQVISLNALDESRTRYLDGEIIQPWHPFTAESESALASGEIAPIDVEIFPTGAVINEGDRLRISIQTFDLPHLAPPVNQLPGALGVVTIHNSAEHPSRLVLPAFDLPVLPQVPGGDAVSNNRTGDNVDEVAVTSQGPLGGVLPATGSPVGLFLMALLAAALLGGGSRLFRSAGDRNTDVSSLSLRERAQRFRR